MLLAHYVTLKTGGPLKWALRKGWVASHRSDLGAFGLRKEVSLQQVGSTAS